MSTNLVEEITMKAAALPLEKQREVLALMEKLAAHGNQPKTRCTGNLKGSTADKSHTTTESDKSQSPRRFLKGDLAHHGSSVTSEEIEEARREMWRGYMGGDDE